MTEDEKDFEEWWKKEEYSLACHTKALRAWLAACRKQREKIKADLSIGKFDVNPPWPESPDY